MINRFDQAASLWDTPARTERAAFIAAKMAAAVEFNTNLHVLEFGCGTALISRSLIQNIGRLTLVDSSRQMLSIAKEKIESCGREIQTGAELSLTPVESNAIDILYSSMALHHVRDIEGCAADIGRIMKSGGKLCIVDLMPEDGSFHGDDESFDGHFGFDPVQLSSHFLAAGFGKAQHRVIYSGKKPIGDKSVDYSLFLLVMTKA